MRPPGRAHPLTNPTVPTGPHQSELGDRWGGGLTAAPVRISIVAAALLFVSSLWTPDPHNTLTVCSGYHSGALKGGRGRESGSTSGPAAVCVCGGGGGGSRAPIADYGLCRICVLPHSCA